MRVLSYGLGHFVPWIFPADQSQGANLFEGFSKSARHEPLADGQAMELLVTEAAEGPAKKITSVFEVPIDGNTLGDIALFGSPSQNPVDPTSPEVDKLEGAGCSHAEALGRPEILEPQVFGFAEQVPQGGSSPQDIAKPLVFPRDSLSPKDNSTGHQDKRPLYVSDERDEKNVPESTVLVVPVHSSPVHSSPVHSSKDLPIIFPDDPLYPNRKFTEYRDDARLYLPDEEASSEDSLDVVGTPFAINLIDFVDIR